MASKRLSKDPNGATDSGSSQERSWGQPLALGIALVAGVAILQRFVGLGRSFAVCRWLSSEELGRWDLSFAFLMSTAPLVVLGIPGSFGRFAEDYRVAGKSSQFILSTALACLASLLVSILCTVIFYGPISQFWLNSAPDLTWITTIIPALVLTVLFNYLSSLASGLRLHKIYARVQAIHGIVFAVACLVLLPLMAFKASSVVNSYAAACGLGAAILAYEIRREFRQKGYSVRPMETDSFIRETRESLVQILPFAISICVATFITNAFSMGGRLLLLHWSESEATGLLLVGYYHTARIIPRLMTQFAGTISGMATPHFVKDFNEQGPSALSNRLSTLLKAMSLGFTAAGSAVLLAAPTLFAWVLEERSDVAIAWLPWVLASSITLSMSLVMQNVFWCTNRSWQVSITYAAGLATNFAFAVLLEPRFGPLAILISTFASTLLILWLQILLAARLGCSIDSKTLILLLLPGILLSSAATATIFLASVFAAVVLHRAFVTTSEYERLEILLHSSLSRMQPSNWLRVRP